MSLIPSLLDDPVDYWRPSRLLDQQFGVDLALDDLLAPIAPRRLRRWLLSSPYDRNWRSRASQRDQGSTVSLDKDKFQVSLDVQQFSPDEITVKASGDDTITIEGKHEEKEDEHGYISRHFVRRYKLPKGHNIEGVQSKLSSDGVLTITAPKETERVKEREIPIALTGPSQAAIANGEPEEKNPTPEKKEARKKK